MADWSNGRYDEFKWKVLEKYKAKDGFVKCKLCNEMIDLSLPGTSNAGFTIDHIYPKELFPEMCLEESNHQPAHRICNNKKGLKPQHQIEAEFLNGNSVNRIY